MGDGMTYEEFETRATAAKEIEISNLWEMVSLAALAVEADAEMRRRREKPATVKVLAHIWHRSATFVRRKAQLIIFPQDLILPWIGEGLYRACLLAEEATNIGAVEWLKRALDNDWKERQLRDAAGIAGGATVSDVVFKADDAETVGWDIDDDVVALRGLGISGEQPARVRAKLQEVIG